MPAMSTASVTSPRKADAIPAMSRMITSGLAAANEFIEFGSDPRCLQLIRTGGAQATHGLVGAETLARGLETREELIE